MRKILGPSFFNRTTLQVAQELIGKFIVRKVGKREVALMITETESYDGFKDKASKGSRGRTPGNAPMFHHPGTIYVYFTYGMHWMLNIATREKDYPAAVLIRGAGDIVGPARLTKALGIVGKELNMRPLGKSAGLWVEDRGVVIPKKRIKRTPRIGIDSAGSPWVEKKYRFVFSSESDAKRKENWKK